MTASALRSNPPVEITFFSEFLETDLDYNDVILKEAHAKHEVPLNVPPQMPPPNEPAPRWNAALRAKLALHPPPYVPTHGPPPLETTGRRLSPPPAFVSTPVAAASPGGAAGVGSARRATSAKPPSSGKAERAPPLALPSFDDVLEALTDVWDVYAAKVPGVKAFVPTPSTSLRQYADKKSMRALEGDAAPVAAASASSGDTGGAVCLKSAFPNPLGSAELGGGGTPGIGAPLIPVLGGVSPFRSEPPAAAPAAAAPQAAPGAPVSTLAAAPTPAPAAVAPPAPARVMPSSTDRKFACRSCTRTFRLLDAIVTHYETAHGSKMTEDALEHYRAVARGEASGPPPAVKVSAAPEEGRASATHPSQEYCPESVAAQQRAMPEVEVAAHIRSFSNAALMGSVVEVRHGFLGARAVTQLLLRVDEEATASAAEASPRTAEGPELVTVRCFGEQFAVTVREGVREGTVVLVNGVLKMNRLVDTDSRRSHAYPYVKVMPPFGTLAVMT